MTIGILIPIHDKPLDTLQAVVGAAEAQKPSQLVIVYDRASQAILDVPTNGAERLLIDGKPGWRSPCVSFNAGMEAMRTDITVINHSDVQHMPGNLDTVKAHFAEYPNSVLFAMVLESKPEELQGAGNAGPLLMGTGNPRPLTFLTAIPTAALKAIGGWDLGYMEGVCYEDDDLTARLWKHGLDFHFRDDFSGIHHTHSRGYFVGMRTLPNLTRFVNTHGSRDAYSVVMKSKPSVTSGQGRLSWSHAAAKTG